MRAEGHHLETMDVLSQYLFDLFKSKLAVSENEKPLSLQPPLQLSTALLADAEHLSTILAKAYRRPSEYIISNERVSLMYCNQYGYRGVPLNMLRICHPDLLDSMGLWRTGYHPCFRHVVWPLTLLLMNLVSLLILKVS